MEHKVTIHAHDPVAIPNMKKYFASLVRPQEYFASLVRPQEYFENATINFHESVDQVLQNQVIVVLTDWDEYKNIKLFSNKIVFDARNLFDMVDIEKSDILEYRSIGRRAYFAPFVRP